MWWAEHGGGGLGAEEEGADAAQRVGRASVWHQEKEFGTCSPWEARYVTLPIRG